MQTTCLKIFRLSVMHFWIIGLLCIPLMISSCGSDDEGPALFEWTIDVEIDLPRNPDIFQAQIVEITNINNFIDAELSAAGFTRSDIRRIELREARLVELFGEAPLGFMNRIDLSVFSSDAPASDIEIAFREPVELNTGNTLVLFSSLPDITSFFLEPLINLRMEYGVREPNPSLRTRLTLQMIARG